MSKQKLVFITGGTGNMGSETVKEFVNRSDKFRIRLLVRDSKNSRKKLKRLQNNKNVEIVYGDMKDSKKIDQCVKGASFVLHIGALVSPLADDQPEECIKVNYGSTINIINAIKKQPDPDSIGFAYIGTVGETGDRPSPIHWGRVGDPIKVSMFDYYSVSKVASERAVIESGLKKWVVFRQSGMLPVNQDAQNDPITFHQNLNNVIEWSTAEESARLMANICEDSMSHSLWRNVYNIGSGEKWRYSYYELLEKMFADLNVDIKEVFNPKDLALFNFHGHWYSDSDKLEEIAHFRFLDPDEFFDRTNKKIRMIKSIPLLNKVLPTTKSFIKTMTLSSKKERGPQWMLDHNKTNWIDSFWGSIENKNSIKTWEEGYQLLKLNKHPTYLDHGYDETKPLHVLDLEDMKKAADFRGGQCLSQKMINGDLYTPLKWQCHNKHKFEATPYLILKSGHWCSECEKEAWNHAEWAKHNHFFAQVWSPLHGDKNAVYVKKVVSEDLIK
jgi:nucleoside-diphosphate-sugar epimerase